MSFCPHLTVSDAAVKRELVRKFMALEPEEFLSYLYPIMSESEWDRVKENWITTLILAGSATASAQPLVAQLITDTATDTDHMNLVIQEDKGERFQVFTFGDPKYTRFLFMRSKQEDAAVFSKQLCDYNTMIVYFA
jgi:hypothetical protein